ncbi:hypothetical protein KQH74_04850 [Streptococcus sanguinis]|jgi:hypothetical protein|nr:hypothetical protein [Streptococcus sanguinis]MCY7026825.1 hypothetical protein [Streptococcus sanguinis]PLA64696.1 hypothetical protein CYK23_01785 [Streptococcus salivarius]
MMKKSKIATLLIIALIVTLIIGGIVMTVQNQNLFTDGVEREKKKEQDPRKKQLAYLKRHKEELTDFAKALNPKVESVQFNWDSMKVEDIGNGTPKGGGDIIDVYGTFNNIEESGWNVTIPIKDGKADLHCMGLSNGLSLRGELFEQ